MGFIRVSTLIAGKKSMLSFFQAMRDSRMALTQCLAYGYSHVNIFSQMKVSIVLHGSGKRQCVSLNQFRQNIVVVFICLVSGSNRKQICLQ